MELEKIESTLQEVKEQKDLNTSKIEEISTKLNTAVENLNVNLKATKEDLDATKVDLKATKDDLEVAKVDLSESKTALENEKKINASLFAKVEEKKENTEEKIIENYVRNFNESVKSKSYEMDKDISEKAIDLYIKEKLGLGAKEEKVLEMKSIFLAQVSKGNVPLLDFKTLREGVSPDGGYLARNPELGAMQKREFTSLNFRAIAFTQNISSESIDFPIDDSLFADTHHGEESTRAVTATSQIGKVSIKTGEIYAEPMVTLKMIEDSAIDINAWILEKTIQKFELTEEEDFMVGTGLNDRAKGLFTYDAWSDETVYERNKLGTLTLNTVAELADSIIDLYEILPNRAKANAVYLMHPTTWRVILRLKDGISNYLLNANMLSAGYGKTLYGRPVILSDYISPMFTISGATVALVSGVKGIACGDMRETYAIIDRIGLSRLEDPYTAKGFIKFSTRKRVGGGVKNFQTCKILVAA